VARLDAVDGNGDPVEHSGATTVEPDCRFGRTVSIRLRSSAVVGRLKTEDQDQRCANASGFRKETAEPVFSLSPHRCYDPFFFLGYSQ
jgi:hypothetical protein